MCPLQIVLAFGNYMNSSKRGAAYGFRLQSLDLVSSSCLYISFTSTRRQGYIFFVSLLKENSSYMKLLTMNSLGFPEKPIQAF